MTSILRYLYSFFFKSTDPGSKEPEFIEQTGTLSSAEERGLSGTEQSRLFGAEESRLFGAEESHLFGAEQSRLFGAEESFLFGAEESFLFGAEESHPSGAEEGPVPAKKRRSSVVEESKLSIVSKSRPCVEKKGPLSVHEIPLEKEKKRQVGPCKFFTCGDSRTSKPNRTILVLGATGAGKSTLINGMINYILGVEWGDSSRFKLVHEDTSKSQTKSQTAEVTVYKINHQEGFKIDYSLTIVDTPGFGDTGGIEKDREITEQLKNLFSTKDGVTEVDVVCFVAQASLARLTPTQKYVFDSVLSVFGKDIAENIRVLVTFADGQKPPVLEAIKTADVPCPKTEDGLPCHFKFNNSALFADNQTPEADSLSGDDEVGGFDKMFWNMGMRSMKSFFNALNTMETKSLMLTKEVLREREQLENSVEKLQKQVKIGLAKLEQTKETSEKIKEFEAEISRNEKFEIETTITKPVMVEFISSGRFLTNCQQCSFTCHERCVYADDKDKINCIAMGPDGHCTVCPGKCYWNIHFNQKYKWEYQEVTEKRTVAELKEKYDIAKNAKSPVEELFKKLKAQYNSVQATVQRLIKQSGKCLNRLKEIALRPNPLSTPDYIDMLIEGEKSEGKPGWKKRVQSLEDMKKKAEYMEKVERGEKLLERKPADSNQSKKN